MTITNQRQMPGLRDYTGDRANTLQVGQMVRRNPEPAYQCTCGVCGCRQTCSQSHIRSGVARCLNSACGKTDPTPAKQSATDFADRAARLQREAEQAALDASARRMSAETEGYALPSRTLPKTLTPAPVRERDRLAARAHRDELEAIAAAEREAVEKPIRDAEKALKATANQLAEAVRQNISTGTDDAFALDPETLKPIPTATVKAWQRQQSATFKANNPAYFACDENFATISAYIERNVPGIRLVSARQLTDAYRRLSEYGLLKERPVPVEEPTPEPEVAQQPSEPKGELGIDPLTGEPRIYTPREVRMMSSDQYRRCFAITTADLKLPRIGPGPHGRR